MPAPTRKNMTARARSLGIATVDIEHLDDAAYADVVMYRTDRALAMFAQKAVKLIEMGEDFGCLADPEKLMRDDAQMRPAVDELVAKLEEIGLVPERVA